MSNITQLETSSSHPEFTNGINATSHDNNTHTHKPNLIGMPKAELAEQLAAMGLEKFRTKQLWQWLYYHGEQDFAAMTNMSKALRSRLDEYFTIKRPEIVLDLTSEDGTRKWLLKLPDGNQIEMVFIPNGYVNYNNDDEQVDIDDSSASESSNSIHQNPNISRKRGTLCVSSQVGCTLTCRFCHTGTQKLVRNLSAEEIVAQLMVARDCLEDWPKDGTTTENRRINNIVMMGMGEPLYNYDNVAKALHIMMDPDGLSLSRRKITLSTSGVVPEIEKCGRELAVNLAVSLHATNDALRDEIMPLNKKYPIAELMESLRNYPTLSNARRITFEYVMLKDINDSDEDARALIKLISGIPAKINLIPFNYWQGAPYECSSDERIAAFSDIIFKAGYSSPIRTPRGRDIYAACGQLKSESKRLKKSLRA